MSDSRLVGEDESRTTGLLRIEYVLVDFDGDGISERRCIHRLKHKILKNEECSHVPIATASPILITHRWDGMSYAQTVSDLMELKTELTRQMVDSGRLANNPRMEVLTDATGSPYANIDDLLDSRAGGILRKSRPDALSQSNMPWVGGQMFPMLEYVDTMREQRTGVSRVQQGIDPNILKTNRTWGEAKQTAQTAKQRIKLVARIFGEVLLKPTFLGILKLMTEGGMDKLAFMKNDEFIELDPNEWHDQYHMTVNVGLGVGDKDQTLLMLQAVSQSQVMAAQSPLGGMLLSPKQLYNTQAKMIEAAGFKNVGDFWTDPGDVPMPAPPGPPQDPKIQITQMQLQADAQKFQAQTVQDKELEQLKAQAKLQEVQANLELQASNDARDAEREALTAQHRHELAMAQIEFGRYKVDADNQTKLLIAQIGQASQPEAAPADPMGAVSQSIAMLADQMGRPKTVIYDELGRAVGLESNPGIAS